MAKLHDADVGDEVSACDCGYIYPLVASVGIDPQDFREGQQIYINFACPVCGQTFGFKSEVSGPLISSDVPQHNVFTSRRVC